MISTEEARALVAHFDESYKKLTYLDSKVNEIINTSKDTLIKADKRGVFGDYVQQSIAAGALEPLNAETRSAIDAMVRYVYADKIRNTLHQTSMYFTKEYMPLVEALSPATSGLKWFFTSGRKKDAANKALSSLHSIEDAGSLECISKIASRVDEMDNQFSHRFEMTHEFDSADLPSIVQSILPQSGNTNTAPDLERLFKRYEPVMAETSRIRIQIEAVGKQVKKAAEILAAKEAVELLRNISVDVLSSDT